MIQLTSRWHARFLEDILVFVAELSILRFDHSVSSCLVHHRPNQRTPRYSIRITTNQIHKCTCRNNINFDTISHLLGGNHHLVSTCYAITTLTNISTTQTSRSATNTISAWFTHTIFFAQTRHSNTRINPANLWIIPPEEIHSQYHVSLQTFQHVQHCLHCYLARTVNLCCEHQTNFQHVIRYQCTAIRNGYRQLLL